MKNKKTLWQRKLDYWVNEHIGKGATQQFLILFVFILSVMLIFGILVTIFNSKFSFKYGIWESFIHLLDPGTVSGVDTENKSLTILMVIVTIIGMVFTGMLISIINNWLDSKMRDLRKGLTEVLEKNHIIVLGCNTNSLSIIDEQIKSNLNVTKSSGINPCIVVSDSKPKEDIDSEIQSRFSDKHNTKIAVRSGSLISPLLYDMINLKAARSVIISMDNDEETLQVCLALNTYLKDCDKNSAPYIVAYFNAKRFLRAAKSAVKSVPSELLYFSEILGRITAQACRQPGISNVLTNLFNYANEEIYIESKDYRGASFNLEGCKFKDILNRFTNTTVIGISRKNENGNAEIILDPPGDFLLKGDDQIIHLAQDDNSAVVMPEDYNSTREGLSVAGNNYHIFEKEKLNLCIYDWNGGLPVILKNLDGFVSEGSTAIIVSPRDIPGINHLSSTLDNIEISTIKTDALEDPDLIGRLLEENSITNIMFLNDDALSPDEADMRTITLLLYLRSIIDEKEEKTGLLCDYSITSELHYAENQTLMKNSRVNDFIIGSEIVSQVMTQIVNDRRLVKIFDELLTADGAELYIRSVGTYLDLSKGLTVNFADLTTICFSQGDIAIGWVDNKGREPKFQLNPPKNQKLKFGPKDKIIVISQGE